MTTKHSYVDYLQDALIAIDKAIQFVKGMSYDDFAQDDKTAYAVIRALEIIGETSKKIPQSAKDSYPEIS